MRKLTFCTFFILFAVAFASAQQVDQTVESIRKLYTDVAEKARLCETDDEQGKIGALVMNELTINTRDHEWRAVGKYRDGYRFFYMGGDDEDHLYPDQLVFVKRKNEISARSSSEEYLFDEAGRIVFHRHNYVDVNKGLTVREVYFSAVRKPLRVVENGKARDKFSTLDSDVASDILKSAEKLKDLFSRSIKL
ncbi:MAG: hypothetical protein AB7J13_03115 [Pyrinomonadaceae bacterium]